MSATSSDQCRGGERQHPGEDDFGRRAPAHRADALDGAYTRDGASDGVRGGKGRAHMAA